MSKLGNYEVTTEDEGRMVYLKAQRSAVGKLRLRENRQRKIIGQIEVEDGTLSDEFILSRLYLVRILLILIARFRKNYPNHSQNFL